jgi:hypothetical protein
MRGATRIKLTNAGLLVNRQDDGRGFGWGEMPSPAGTLNPFPAVSVVPTGLAELLDMFLGLSSWAKFRRPCGTELGTMILTQTLKPVPFPAFHTDEFSAACRVRRGHESCGAFLLL